MGAAATNQPPPMRRSRLAWPLAVALTIIVASSRSIVAAPNITNIDKLAHFAVYGLLATLICRAGTGWRAAAWALLATSAFGATDEVHQIFVPGRSADVADWLADTSGALLAVTLYTGWHAYRRTLELPVWRRRSAAGRTTPTA